MILCAGVFGSPAILMRSGIGPADHLRSVEVPVRVDLPGVGANLADHPAVSIECGYRGATRKQPILHLVATFHSATMDSHSAPDLMLWVCDPEEPPKARRASTSTSCCSGPVRGVGFACARPIPSKRRTSSSLP